MKKQHMHMMCSYNNKLNTILKCCPILLMGFPSLSYRGGSRGILATSPLSPPLGKGSHTWGPMNGALR